MWQSAMRAETSEPIRLGSAGGWLSGGTSKTLLVSLILQAVLFIWWAAAMSARFDERLMQAHERTQKLEINVQRLTDINASLSDRLARAEERIATQAERLRRLEQPR